MTYIILGVDGSLSVRDYDLTAATTTQRLLRLQKDVGGVIALIRLRGDHVVAWVNEDGPVLGAQPTPVGNMVLAALGSNAGEVVGPIAITGWNLRQENVVSLSPEQISQVRGLHDTALLMR